MNAISATDVTKRYGDVTALEELSLSVETGATFGLLGTNGAGKTTLFKLLVGHARPDAGTLSVAGRDVTTAGESIRSEVGYLPEQAGFPSTLTGREVLSFHGRMRGMPANERTGRIDEVLDTVGLSEAANRAVGGYSNGMNRRLGLATALLSRPSVLLLDEPTAGLDPLGVTAFHRVIRRLRDQTDLTVVLSSHVMTEVEELCDSVAVLHDGRLRETGAIAEVRATTDSKLRVSARSIDESSVAAIADLPVASGCDVVETTGLGIEFACDADSVPELIEELNGSCHVAGFEVTEPGLDQVFEAIVEDEQSDSESDAATGDRPRGTGQIVEEVEG